MTASRRSRAAGSGPSNGLRRDRRAALLLVGWLAAVPAIADCPPTAAITERLEQLPLAAAARTERFGRPIPWELYARAAAAIDTPFPRREGQLIQGTMVSTQPAESWWMAINDDDHHEEGGYLPLRVSEVVRGLPGRSGRETLQYYRSAGFGRWWVNRLEFDADLFERSTGRLWQLSWRDVQERYPEAPRLGEAIRAPAVEETWGSWLLVEVGESCTLVEYVASGDAGGFVGAIQWMGLTRALRSTFRGMVEIAREHLETPHPPTLFVRPDGSVIEP